MIKSSKPVHIHIGLKSRWTLNVKGDSNKFFASTAALAPQHSERVGNMPNDRNMSNDRNMPNVRNMPDGVIYRMAEICRMTETCRGAGQAGTAGLSLGCQLGSVNNDGAPSRPGPVGPQPVSAERYAASRAPRVRLGYTEIQ